MPDADGSDPASSTAPSRSPAASALSYLVACAAFVTVAFVSVPLLHWAQRGAGATSSTTAERAWVRFPGTVDRGLKPGESFGIAIDPPDAQPISWIAADGSRVVDRGVSVGPAGHVRIERVSTLGAQRRSFIIVHVSGLTFPLKVWIR